MGEKTNGDIFQSRPTLAQLIMIIGIVAAIAGSTWQVSNFTRDVTDRLAAVEGAVKRIDDKLERWHKNERAAIDAPVEIR